MNWNVIKKKYINSEVRGGGLGSVVEGLGGASAHVILVLCESIWNAATVRLVLPAFDDTGSLGSPPRRVVYPPGSMVPPWMTASHFPAENKEAELKPTPLSSLLFVRNFLSFLFSSTPCDIVALSAACWGYSLIIKIISISKRLFR